MRAWITIIGYFSLPPFQITSSRTLFGFIVRLCCLRNELAVDRDGWIRNGNEQEVEGVAGRMTRGKAKEFETVFEELAVGKAKSLITAFPSLISRNERYGSKL